MIQMPLPDPVKAEIDTIIPSYRYKEGFNDRVVAEVIRVIDVNKKIYWFVTGSITSIPPNLKREGRKGWIRWIKTPTSMLPYFTDKKKG